VVVANTSCAFVSEEDINEEDGSVEFEEAAQDSKDADLETQPIVGEDEE